MVSTRGHPKTFPPPEFSPSKASPTKRSTRQASSTLVGSDSETNTPSFSPSKAQTGTALAVRPTRSRARSASAWSHIPGRATLAWLIISLPLVLWDCGYVLGRPHTMPGGKWHSPLYVPYALYATVDYLYGFPAIEKNQGFTGAQGFMNILETVLYVWYLYYVFAYGRAIASSGSSKILAKRRIVGSEAGLAVLVGFSAAIMTWSKTVLYFMVNYYEGWEGIKQNDWSTLFFLWIVPNGAWIVMSAWMMYDFGAEIVQGLEQAAGLPQKKKD